MRRRALRGVILAALCALAGSACGARPIAHAEESPAALARAVLTALEARDVNRLGELALNEAEFRAVVWPELPASRSERNLPFGYVWADLRTKSHNGLSQVVGSYGGRRYELVSVRFAGPTTQYQTFLVHRDAVLAVRDSNGEHQVLKLFGSVLERDRRFKIFSYVVDD
jgi:hypothetical protein